LHRASKIGVDQTDLYQACFATVPCAVRLLSAFIVTNGFGLIPTLRESDSLGIERSRYRGGSLAEAHLGRSTPIDFGQDLFNYASTRFGLCYIERRLPVQDSQVFAQPAVCFLRITENLLGQRLYSREPYQTIRLYREGLFSDLSMSTGPGGDDEMLDLSI